MVSLLHAYLVDNKSLYLPGAGRIHLVRQPASFDVANQLLQPPHTVISFRPGEDGSNNPDSLTAFLASRLDIATDKAAALFRLFCQKLVADLNTNGNFHWHPLGNFTKEASGDIVFLPAEGAAGINKPVPAIRIIRPGSVHHMVVGNSETTSTIMQEYLTEQAVVKPVARWWLAPLLIGIAAMVLIILRKMQYI